MQIVCEPGVLAVHQCLAAAELPTDDVTSAMLSDFFGLMSADGTLAGVVGLEVHADAALLRSLAVDSAARGGGLGRQLVDIAERHARSRGVRRLYLLTTTAARFFERLGYAQTDREGVPQAIAGTAQFAGLCPDAAICMVRCLDDPSPGDHPSRPGPASPRARIAAT